MCLNVSKLGSVLEGDARKRSTSVEGVCRDRLELAVLSKGDAREICRSQERTLSYSRDVLRYSERGHCGIRQRTVAESVELRVGAEADALHRGVVCQSVSRDESHGVGDRDACDSGVRAYRKLTELDKSVIKSNALKIYRADDSRGSDSLSAGNNGVGCTCITRGVCHERLSVLGIYHTVNIGVHRVIITDTDGLKACTARECASAEVGEARGKIHVAGESAARECIITYLLEQIGENDLSKAHGVLKCVNTD